MRTIRAAYVSGDYWTEEVTETPAETASVTFCPIRFQGQWEDAETGLYQNKFRYYDPGAGQYLSPDPVGAAGGLNLHGYVSWPHLWIDPYGLTGVYIFETLNGTCYVGKGPPTREAASQLQRTREDRSRAPGQPRAGCCSFESYTDLATQAAAQGVSANDYALMVERGIMDLTGASQGNTIYANAMTTGTAARNRNPGAMGAANTDAAQILADFRRNNPGTIC